MTDDGKFVSSEDFRVNATTDDVMELFDFYLKYEKGKENFPGEKEPNPECRFQFSANEAERALCEFTIADTGGQNLMYAIDFIKEIQFLESFTKEEQPEGAVTKEEVHFTICKGKQEFVKRSVMMTDDHWNRLQKICNQYTFINKSYVLHTLLEEILLKYEV